MTKTIGAVLLASLLGGCAYDDYYTFASSRKLLDSDAPGVTKSAGAALLVIPDALASPVTSLLDASQHAPRNEGHIYLSYVGLRTLVNADLHPAQKIAGGVFVFVVDTLWFPAALGLDVAHVLSRKDGDEGHLDQEGQAHDDGQALDEEALQPLEPPSAAAKAEVRHEPVSPSRTFWADR